MDVKEFRVNVKVTPDSPLDMVRRALRFEETTRVPAIPIVGLFACSVTGIPVHSVLTDADQQAQALLRCLREFSYDGVFTVMDLTLEAEALGAETRFPTDAFPYVSQHPLSDPTQIVELDPLDVDGTRLNVFVDTTAALAREVGESHLVSSYVIGPFTLAGHLLGISRLLEAVMETPDSVRAALSRCVDIIEPYVGALVAAGAHNIVILEPSASNSIISPHHFREFSRPFLERQVEQIHHAGAMATVHICGRTGKIIKDMCETGADALSIDSAVDLHEAKSVAHGQCALIGNIDTSLLLEGTPDDVRHAAREAINEASDGGGYVLSSGCDLPIETPVQNLRALLMSAR
ncbi:MAG: hypothetical protein DRO93_11860 [Candidatus Thorarchaeota archaeon]|nr:MAG: hypothetical protein DRO93_11860 [Candidatus Thorarchaeota archaeon]